MKHYEVRKPSAYPSHRDRDPPPSLARRGPLPERSALRGSGRALRMHWLLERASTLAWIR